MRINFKRHIEPQYQAALPPGETKLDLADNNLGSHSRAIVLLTLSVIPAIVTSLDIKANSLYRLSKDDLKLVIAAIKRTITTLDLSSNHLHRFDVGLIEIFNALKDNINTLILSLNSLHLLKPRAVALALAAIPATVITLDLTQCNLAHFGADLKFILAVIKATTLNLSWNNLKCLSFSELKLIFASIPKEVRTLNLSNNHFDFTEAQWIELLSELPGTVDQIIINGSDDVINQEQITKILKNVRKKVAQSCPLPSTLTELILEYATNPDSFWNNKTTLSKDKPLIKEPEEEKDSPLFDKVLLR